MNEMKSLLEEIGENSSSNDGPHESSPATAPTRSDMTSVRSIILYLAFLPLLAGCDLLDRNEPEQPGVTAVVVANQGNFSDGNGSVTVYDPLTGLNRPAAITDLGSIVQSLLLAHGRLYVAANTGGRVDVFDAESLQRVGQFADVVSPRYMLPVGDRVYVTNLFGAHDSFTGGKVTVLDPDSGVKVNEIEVGDNPEGLALVGDRMFVANNGFGNGRTLHVIDTRTDAVAATVDVDCDGPRFLSADRRGRVFVVCTGRTIYDDQFNVIGETNGAVRVVEATSGDVVARFEVDGRLGTAGPGQDAFFAGDAELLFVVKDASSVLVFDTALTSLVREIGPFDGPSIGAVAYDEREGLLYVGRNRGFAEAGVVTVHDQDGVETGRFDAGVAPAYIAFRAED